jgi:hypothetical protein
MVYKVELVFDDGVIDGTQNEGKVVLEAWPQMLARASMGKICIYLLTLNGLSGLGSLLTSNTKKFLFV